MGGKVIVVQGDDLFLEGSPSSFFQVFSLETKKLVSPEFTGPGEAQEWATKEGAELVDDWDENDLVAQELELAAVPSSEARVVMIRLWVRGILAPAHRQPKYSFWVLNTQGLIIKVLKCLAEAVGCMQQLEDEKNKLVTSRQIPGTRGTQP